MSSRLLPVWLAAAMLTACTPSLDWRQVQGVGEQPGWFPCKPDRVERAVALEGREQRVPATLAACDAQGLSWSSLALQFPDPAQAAAALGPARQALRANLVARESAPPAGLTGAGVQGLQWFTGQRGGGEPVQVAVRFQVEGRWLVQRVLLHPGVDAAWPRALDDSALRTFFDAAFPTR